MRIEPEPGIGKMAAVAASERPKPDAALVRPDICKDPGDDHSSALRACHRVVSPNEAREGGPVIVLPGEGPEQWRAALPYQ